MNLHDVARDHTSYFVVLVLMAIPICVWAVSLTLGVISGEVDTLVGVGGTFSVVALGAAAMTPSFYEYAPLLAVLAYGSFLVVPLCKRIFDQKELRSIQVEKLEKAYMAMGMRPDNPALKFKLAAMLYEEGMVDAAIAIGKSVIERMPQRVFPEENRHFRAWLASAAGDAPSTFRCPGCGYANKPGDVFCQSCSEPFFLLMIQTPGKQGNLGAKFISIWLTLVIVGIAIPAALLTLPIAFAFCVMVLMILMCGFILARAFGQQREVTD